MSNILLDIRDGVATITLNRPEKLNAFAGTMREELVAALAQVSSDAGARAVILTGAGRGFCSGGDVDAMSSMQKTQDVEGFVKLLDAGREIVTAIRGMDKIVIAAVNGVAAGAGCNLALACDLRLASDEARFGETFVRIGLHPDWGGSWFLPRLVGPSRALELMATGRIVDAAEALRIGMVDRVVPAGDLQEEARKLAVSIASGPPIPIAALKRSIDAARSSTLDQQLALETEIQLRAFRSQDSAEGMAAFFEKRKPEFQGR